MREKKGRERGEGGRPKDRREEREIFTTKSIGFICIGTYHPSDGPAWPTHKMCFLADINTF